jgi:uncharacterized protein (DUF302 family)
MPTLQRTSKDSVIERSSTLSIEEVRLRIGRTLEKHGFAVVGMHDVMDRYLQTGHVLEDSIFVCEFSSPGLARDAYRQWPQLSVFGFSRISIYSVQGQTRLAALLPSSIMKLLPREWVSAKARKPYLPVVRDYDRRIKRVLAELAS